VLSVEGGQCQTQSGWPGPRTHTGGERSYTDSALHEAAVAQACSALFKHDTQSESEARAAAHAVVWRCRRTSAESSSLAGACRQLHGGATLCKHWRNVSTPGVLQRPNVTCSAPTPTTVREKGTAAGAGTAPPRGCLWDTFSGFHTSMPYVKEGKTYILTACILTEACTRASARTVCQT
jgi:hypothetical protein